MVHLIFLLSSFAVAALLSPGANGQTDSSGNDSGGGILSGSVEQLVANATSVANSGRVDVIKVDNGNGGEKEYGICNIVGLVPLMKGAMVPFAQLAIAAHLAVEHLNSGNGSIIPQLQGLDDTCNVRFNFEVVDTLRQRAKAVDKTIEYTNREDKSVCTFVTIPDKETLPVGIITGTTDIPLLSPASSSVELDSKELYPRFARSVTSGNARRVMEIDYFCNVVGSRFLIILHEEIDASIAVASSLVSVAARDCPEMSILPISLPQLDVATDMGIKAAAMAIKSSGYRHILMHGAKSMFLRVLKAGGDIGISGRDSSGYLWAGSFPIFDPVEEGSQLHEALPGVAVLNFEAGYPGLSSEYDNFLQTFQQLANPSDLAYINSHMPYPPKAEKNGQMVPVLPPLTFNRVMIDFTYFMFDAIIALGLAACSATKGNGMYFDGTSLYGELLNTTFDGTTGGISFDESGSRNPTTALFSVKNIRADEPINGTVSFSATRTHSFRNGKWQQLEQFVYSDGTTVPPPDTPYHEVNMNYIGSGLRAGGLVLCTIILALSLGWAFWTRYFVKTHVVRASQPIFLYIICFGTFMIGAAIIPLSIDDEVASNRGCDIACMAEPYLLCIGWALVFAALFSKMWRVNQIFNNPTMKRIKITVADVIKPLIALLVVNVLILGLWTGFNPRVWEREVVSVDNFGNPIESVGSCTSEGSLPYVISIVVIDLSAMVVALYQSYKARKISLEFSESSYIAASIALIIVVCFVGIPVIIIASNQPQARFFVVASIFFVITTSLLLFIFVPKEKYRREKRSIKDAIRSNSAAMKSRTASDLSRTSSMGSDAEDVGLAVLRSPKAVQELEEKVDKLVRENAKLKTENSELKGLVNQVDGGEANGDEEVGAD